MPLVAPVVITDAGEEERKKAIGEGKKKNQDLITFLKALRS